MPTYPYNPYSRGNDPDQDQVALFIDWDNLVISNYADRGANRPNIEVIVQKAQQYGTLVIARAYAEWSVTMDRMEVYKSGVEPIYAPVFHSERDLSGQTGKGKSLADPVMVTDCIDFLHLLPQVGTYVLVTGDKDMMPVVRLAKLRGRRVVVIGPDYVANVLQQICDEFVSYRMLLAVAQPLDPYAAYYQQQQPGYYPGMVPPPQQPGYYPNQPQQVAPPQSSSSINRSGRRIGGRRERNVNVQPYKDIVPPQLGQPQQPPPYGGYYNNNPYGAPPQAYPGANYPTQPPQYPSQGQQPGQPPYSGQPQVPGYPTQGQQPGQSNYPVQGQGQSGSTQPNYPAQGQQPGQSNYPAQGQPNYSAQGQSQPAAPAQPNYSPQTQSQQGYGQPNYPVQGQSQQGYGQPNYSPQTQSQSGPNYAAQPQANYATSSYKGPESQPGQYPGSQPQPVVQPVVAPPTPPIASTPVTARIVTAPPEAAVAAPERAGSTSNNNIEEVKEAIRSIMQGRSSSGRGQMRARDLKEELLRRIPNFSERRYGFSKFKALLNAMEQAGILQMDQSGHILWVSAPGTPKPTSRVLDYAEALPNNLSPLPGEETEEEEDEEEEDEEEANTAPTQELEAAATLVELATYQSSALELEDEPELEQSTLEAAVQAPEAVYLPPAATEERVTSVVETPAKISQWEREPEPAQKPEQTRASSKTAEKFPGLGARPLILEQAHYEGVIVLVESLRHRNRWLGYELLLSSVRDYLTRHMPESEAKSQAGAILSKLLNEGVLKMAMEVHSRGARKMRVQVAHLQEDHPAVRYTLAAAAHTAAEESAALTAAADIEAQAQTQAAALEATVDRLYASAENEAVSVETSFAQAMPSEVESEPTREEPGFSTLDAQTFEAVAEMVSDKVEVILAVDEGGVPVLQVEAESQQPEPHALHEMTESYPQPHAEEGQQAEAGQPHEEEQLSQTLQASQYEEGYHTQPEMEAAPSLPPEAEASPFIQVEQSQPFPSSEEARAALSSELEPGQLQPEMAAEQASQAETDQPQQAGEQEQPEFIQQFRDSLIPPVSRESDILPDSILKDGPLVQLPPEKMVMHASEAEQKHEPEPTEPSPNHEFKPQQPEPDEQPGHDSEAAQASAWSASVSPAMIEMSGSEGETGQQVQGAAEHAPAGEEPVPAGGFTSTLEMTASEAAGNHHSEDGPEEEDGEEDSGAAITPPGVPSRPRRRRHPLRPASPVAEDGSEAGPTHQRPPSGRPSSSA